MNWREKITVRILLLVARMFCDNPEIEREIKNIATTVAVQREEEPQPRPVRWASGGDVMSLVDETIIECDERGFMLALTGDLTDELQSYLADADGHTVYLRLSQDAAIQLFAQTRMMIGPWLQEMEFERDAYARASDEERDAVLNGILPSADSSYVESALAAGDLARKRAKGE